MSSDQNKLKNVKDKESKKISTVVIICIFLAPFTNGLSIFYMFYYIIKKSMTMINSSTTTYTTKQKDNLYEELEDPSTKDYYRYDKNDISQNEIHEHREDFWNVNSPIKYK